MSDPDVEREEEENAERKVRGEEEERHHGLIGTIERAFDAVLSPLTREHDTSADAESRRRATDAEERE
jgi:hypothetical protein